MLRLHLNRDIYVYVRVCIYRYIYMLPEVILTVQTLSQYIFIFFAKKTVVMVLNFRGCEKGRLSSSLQ